MSSARYQLHSMHCGQTTTRRSSVSFYFFFSFFSVESRSASSSPASPEGGRKREGFAEPGGATATGSRRPRGSVARARLPGRALQPAHAQWRLGAARARRAPTQELIWGSRRRGVAAGAGGDSTAAACVRHSAGWLWAREPVSSQSARALATSQPMIPCATQSLAARRTMSLTGNRVLM